MNSRYLFDKECDNEGLIVDSEIHSITTITAKIFSTENTTTVNITEVSFGSQLSESVNSVRKITSNKFHSNVV